MVGNRKMAIDSINSVNNPGPRKTVVREEVILQFMKTNEASIIAAKNTTERAVATSLLPFMVTLAIAELVKFLWVVTLGSVEMVLANELKRHRRQRQ